MNIFKILIPLFIMGSAAAQASTMSYYKTKVPEKNRVYVDSAYLLLSGVSVGYEYSLTDHLTAGPFASFFSINNKDTKTPTSSEIEIENQGRQFGLKGRFFLTNKNTERGPYLLGALTQVHVESQAKFVGSSAKDKMTKDTTGYQAGAGYQLTMETALKSDFIINLAALYGTGFGIKTTAYALGSGPTTIDQVNIQDSIFIEASIGMLF